MGEKDLGTVALVLESIVLGEVVAVELLGAVAKSGFLELVESEVVAG